MYAAVEVKDLKAYYKVGSETFAKAVDGVSFSIGSGQIVGIAGESGCGKSTLIKACTRSGKFPLLVLGGKVYYTIDEKKIDIYELSEEEMRELRWNHFALVPQAAMNSLNPVMKIEQIFLETLVRNGKTKQTEVRDMMLNAIDEMGLPSTVLKMYPCQLSGGMKQRVVLALALITNPKVVFCDEPTSGLDLVTQKGILELIRDKAREKGITLIFVSHDMGIHAQITDTLIVMYAGKIVEIGPTPDVFKNPLHPYTRALIDSLPVLGDKVIKSGLHGVPPSLINPPEGCRFRPRCSKIGELCVEDEPMLVEVQPNRWVSCWSVEKK